VQDRTYVTISVSSYRDTLGEIIVSDLFNLDFLKHI